MAHLTRQQITRQDFVDNQIFELINNLLPLSKQREWNIELIASTRETIRYEIVEKSKTLTEKQFYPFMKI